MILLQTSSLDYIFFSGRVRGGGCDAGGDPGGARLHRRLRRHQSDGAGAGVARLQGTHRAGQGDIQEVPPQNVVRTLSQVHRCDLTHEYEVKRANMFGLYSLIIIFYPLFLKFGLSPTPSGLAKFSLTSNVFINSS